MKMREIMGAQPALRRRRCAGCRRLVARAAGARSPRRIGSGGGPARADRPRRGLRLPEALDDDPVARGQPGGDDPVGAERAVGDHVARVTALLSGPTSTRPSPARCASRDRPACGTRKALVSTSPGRSLARDEHARQQHAVGIGEAGAQRHRAGGRVDHRLGELDARRSA